MEFLDGRWEKKVNTWEELLGNSLLNQEAVWRSRSQYPKYG